MARRGANSLEEAFINYLEEADAEFVPDLPDLTPPQPPAAKPSAADTIANSLLNANLFSLRRLFSYTRRESLELRRDPVRLTLAMLGSVILMLVMGYGISLDVEDLTYAVLDRDQTALSRDYTLNLAGSRYFSERPPYQWL